MRYKKLLEHVAPKSGLKATSRYKGLMLNEATGAIFPVSRWGLANAQEQKRPYNEHSVGFYFAPGDICVLNVVPLALYDLVPYGMSGKFEARKSAKSEYTFIHELFDKYESFPGMKISMIDGKPLDARLLDDIEYNKPELMHFEKRLAEIKKVFFVTNRIKDKEPQYKVGRSHRDITIERREFLVHLLECKSLPPKWTEKLEPYYGQFWYQAKGYRSSKDGPPDYNKVFDNMIRFDKAALFRALKVIT